MSANRSRSGLVYALVSAGTFGVSGPLGKSLLEAGWSPGATVGARIGLAAAVMLVPTLLMMRGRWSQMRRGLGIMAMYGVIAIALCQFCFFNAVARMSPPVALMLEYLAPIIIVGWLWLRTGRRPGLLTVAGTVVAIVGLVLVLNLFSATRVDPVGVLWGMGAAACLAVYFVLSAKADGVLPPFAMVGGGMVFGAVGIGVLAVVGVLPLSATFGTVQLWGTQTSWLVPILGITLVAAVAAYSLGIVAAQHLGAKVASFVSLTEVLFSVLASWLFIGEVPAPVQALGGALIVAGVVLVRVDELRAPAGEPLLEESVPEPLPTPSA
ncbi:EamA family transporter [Sinomonas humi]|uniref:Membrane protein n=1 Tax=Sinomonas humi TaxID=1338436 RepID=A0A0B2ALA6_9MICC|nr:DMT family transporter [Sinomonas humi]KHL04425.1 membrane protein [Sinomonas humi]